jgi:hypothetical protein
MVVMLYWKEMGKKGGGAVEINLSTAAILKLFQDDSRGGGTGRDDNNSLGSHSGGRGIKIIKINNIIMVAVVMKVLSFLQFFHSPFSQSVVKS